MIEPKKDVFCLYGCPQDASIVELTRWLDEKEERYLVILDEEEVESFHKRVRFCRCTDEEFRALSEELVFLEFEYAKDCGNQGKDRRKMEEVFRRLAFFQQKSFLSASDFRNKGVDHLANLFKNARYAPLSRDARGLFGTFSKTPAIICGAAPSIERDLPYLKTLQDRALLFCGKKAHALLSEQGVDPHFVGHIDPHLPGRDVFEGGGSDLPLFYQNRAHFSVIERHQGPLLWVPGGQNDLFDREQSDWGWNVSTFLTSLACHMGCDPIVLLGVDLCEKEGGDRSRSLSDSQNEDWIEIEEGTFTRNDWLFGAQWLQEFAAKHPEVNWYNASHGLELTYYKRENLHAIGFDLQEDLRGQVHSALYGIKEGIGEIDIPGLKGSFFRCKEFCKEILKRLEALFPTPPEKDRELALLNFEVEKEEAYYRFLRPIWDIWKPAFARQILEHTSLEYGLDLQHWLFIGGICDEVTSLRN